MNTVYFNSTALNGKYQVMTKEELVGDGIIKIASNAIFTHKGEMHKNVNNYWMPLDTLNKIKSTYNTERACF